MNPALAKKALEADAKNILRGIAEGKRITKQEREIIARYASGTLAMGEQMEGKIQTMGEREEARLADRGLVVKNGQHFAKLKKDAVDFLRIANGTFEKWRKRGVFTKGADNLWGPLEDQKQAYLDQCGRGRPATEKTPIKMDAAKGVSRGAEHALARLEEIEAKTHATFLSAWKTGDQSSIKFTYEMWQSSLKSLRGYEQSIDRDRREIGELMPQAAVAKFLFQLGAAMARTGPECTKRISIAAAKEHDHRKIAAELWKHIPESLLTYLDHAIHAGKLPEWAVDSLKEGLGLK